MKPIDNIYETCPGKCGFSEAAWLSSKQSKMRKLPVLILICLSISRSLQQKSKFYNVININKAYCKPSPSQANPHGRATPKAGNVLYRLWMALSHTQSALQLQNPKAMPGALSRVIRFMEDNQSNRPEGKEGIGNIVAPMEMEWSHLTAHMVSVRIPNKMIKPP